MIFFLCDQCQKIISETELRDGSIRKKNGEVICVECSVSKKGSRETFSCDRCEKKHSLDLLRAGKASLVKGKIYCHRCKEYAQKKSKELLDLKYLVLIFTVFLGIPIIIGSSMWLQHYFKGSSQRENNNNNKSKEYVALQEQMKKILQKIQNRNSEDTQKISKQPDDATHDTEQHNSLDDILNTFKRKNNNTKEKLPKNFNRKKVASITKQLQNLENLFHEPLAKDIKKGNHREKIEAILQVMRTQEYSCIPELTDALKDKDELVRCFAAKALGSLGARESISQLIGIASDRSGLVRKSTTQSLTMLTGQNFKDTQDFSDEEIETLFKIIKKDK